MSRATLEVADIFRVHGAAWRHTHAGHLSLGQLKVMSAIEQCRSAALGGHVLRCERCATTHNAYNSCRNRHCPKCQGSACAKWMEARAEELLPVEYFHVVFTLPDVFNAIALAKGLGAAELRQYFARFAELRADAGLQQFLGESTDQPMMVEGTPDDGYAAVHPPDGISRQFPGQ